MVKFRSSSLPHGCVPRELEFIVGASFYHVTRSRSAGPFSCTSTSKTIRIAVMPCNASYLMYDIDNGHSILLYLYYIDTSGVI